MTIQDVNRTNPKYDDSSVVISDPDSGLWANVEEVNGKKKLHVIAETIAGSLNNYKIKYAQNGVNTSLIVNGSVTPVTFTIPSNVLDFYINELCFFGVAPISNAGQFLSLNSPLTNGLLLSIKSSNIITTFPAIKRTDDLFSLVCNDSDAYFPSTTNKLFRCSLKLENPIIIKKTGSYPTNDYINVTIRDNLTGATSIVTFQCVAKGYQQ